MVWLQPLVFLPPLHRVARFCIGMDWKAGSGAPCELRDSHHRPIPCSCDCPATCLQPTSGEGSSCRVCKYCTFSDGTPTGTASEAQGEVGPRSPTLHRSEERGLKRAGTRSLCADRHHENMTQAAGSTVPYRTYLKEPMDSGYGDALSIASR